jgi:DNA-binding protein H-NS
MSELTMMAEAILETMQAVEEAHNAAQELRRENNHSAFDAFKAKMSELEEHLGKLKRVLDNEEAYAMDELMDALSRAYSDHGADYRRTPRITEQ